MQHLEASKYASVPRCILFTSAILLTRTRNSVWKKSLIRNVYVPCIRWLPRHFSLPT